MLRVSHDGGKTWTLRQETSQTRTCLACKITLPATSEYFDPAQGGSSKYLSRRCRPCESKRLWRDPEWFWRRQEERDVIPFDHEEKAWGGHEPRYGNILDHWPEYGDADISAPARPDDDWDNVSEDDYSEESAP